MNRGRADDPVFVEVAWNRLISIVEQEAQALLRTAFTTIVRESGDLSAGVFDTRGLMIAQAVTGTPGHINSMALAVENMLNVCPRDSLKPGDVLATNDPWLASGHLNDITVVTPVFHRGRLAAFTASTCHALDIGGRGLGTEAVDCYEEGFLLPVCNLYAAGRRQQALDLLQANVREPEAVLGDVHAQVAGNALGAHRLQEMMTEFELPDLDSLADAIFERSEAGMRTAIAAIPDGEYRHEVELDGFAEPVILRVRVAVEGSDLLVDYTGSNGPSTRGINVVLNYTRAYTTYGVKCVVAPDVPNNAGSFRPVTVTAPEGSILNARRPAPVACRHLVGLSLPDAVIGALAQAVPDRVVAQGSSSIWVIDTRGRGMDDRPYAYAFFASGGMGARSDKDGLSATQFPSTVRNVPAEVIESVSPVVVHRRALARDTGGAGRFRGGLGVTMEIGVRTRADYLFTASFERVTVPPQGLFGGRPGACGSVATAAGQPLDPMAKHRLDAADRIVLQTPGGGGVGAPLTREPQTVADDVMERRVSVEAARNLYGVIVDAHGILDEVATLALRASRAPEYSSPDGTSSDP
jgi:N-methylhydantoinase B